MKSIRLAVVVMLSIVAFPISAFAECPSPKISALRPFPVQGFQPYHYYPALGTNADGRLEVFVIGNDGSLWHAWQLQSDNKKWSAWSSFGHPPDTLLHQGARQVRRIAVANDRDGRLQVFVANLNRVWQIGQVVKNVNWGGWHQVAALPAYLSADSVWAISNQDGRIELFVADRFRDTLSFSPSSLYHIWQMSDYVTWFGKLVDFGWPNTYEWEWSGPRELALARDRDGRIHLATVSYGNTYVRRQRAANTDWGAWEQLPRPDGVGFVDSDVVLANNADHRLELVVGARPNWWHTWQWGDAELWSQWANFGRPNVGASYSPELVQGAGQCLNLIALVAYEDTTGEGIRTGLVGLYQKNESSDWRDWGPVSNDTTTFRISSGSMAAARRSDGLIEIFVSGEDGYLLHATQY